MGERGLCNLGEERKSGGESFVALESLGASNADFGNERTRIWEWENESAR